MNKLKNDGLTVDRDVDDLVHRPLQTSQESYYYSQHNHHSDALYYNHGHRPFQQYEQSYQKENKSLSPVPPGHGTNTSSITSKAHHDSILIDYYLESNNNVFQNSNTENKSPPPEMKLHEPTKTRIAPKSILKSSNPHVYTTHLTPNSDKSMHSSMSNFPRPSLSPTNPTSPTRSLSPQSSSSQMNMQFQYKIEQQNNSVTQPLIQKPTNLNTRNLPINMEYQRSPVQYTASPVQCTASPVQYTNDALLPMQYQNQGYSPEIPSTPTFRRQNSAESSNSQNYQGYSPEITITPISKRQDSSDSSSTQNSQRSNIDSAPEPQYQAKLMHRVKSLRSATSPQNVGGLESMKKPTTIDDYVSQAIRYHENDQLEKSTEYFHIAAKQNNTIGMIFYEMLKTIDDSANSQILKTGLVLAIYELGMCYKHGWGVPKDKVKAAHYYKMAADQGDPDAQNDIAHCYYKGEGVKKDMKTGTFIMADKQGYGTMGNSWIFKEKYNN
ncbi:328_t:CDS:2 [Racocetra fulgida]|uniref:328_t:CDS:1 n=1 Tax=Racocetra fulgida TaxID=60492 RepID=A0A9N9F0B2_9GLOM|nr:328_t:CDS:2 [Racocetra fulgida]